MLFFPTADGLEEVLLSPYFLVGFSVFIVTVMNAPIKLFSLKFKNFKWRGNELRYSFIFTSVILLMALEFAGLALVILMYLFSGLFSKKLH